MRCVSGACRLPSLQAMTPLPFLRPMLTCPAGKSPSLHRTSRRRCPGSCGNHKVTDNPNHAVWFADRAMLLQDGSSLADGARGEVLTGEAIERVYRSRIETIGNHTARVVLPG